MVYSTLVFNAFSYGCCASFFSFIVLRTKGTFIRHTHSRAMHSTIKRYIKVDAYLPFFDGNVSSFAAFSHISDRSLLYTFFLWVQCWCTSTNPYVELSDNNRLKLNQTKPSKSENSVKKTQLQCNKYKMMALNNTEADSPTNLTINNVCALLLLFVHDYLFFINIVDRHQDACMRVSVLRIRITRIIMGCLKTVLIKRTKVRTPILRVMINWKIGAKPFRAILQMTNELFHSWFAVHHKILPRQTFSHAWL